MLGCQLQIEHLTKPGALHHPAAWSVIVKAESTDEPRRPARSAPRQKTVNRHEYDFSVCL